ncbi:hypothetical protein NECAME_16592 [Necator americanus]|uniref:Tc1-like transposase DDE domain-containing protein n=1 Tax=Necator americanus TaxID=51031 RepID=W2TVQ9_NECAM|nr:hypothetical protein NECAME_16592 [Necator americanus]ETN85893.1 hypothetical protein NECAME_16592 [Necator americanus]
MAGCTITRYRVPCKTACSAGTTVAAVLASTNNFGWFLVNHCDSDSNAPIPFLTDAVRRAVPLNDKTSNVERPRTETSQESTDNRATAIETAFNETVDNETDPGTAAPDDAAENGTFEHLAGSSSLSGEVIQQRSSSLACRGFCEKVRSLTTQTLRARPVSPTSQHQTWKPLLDQRSRAIGLKENLGVVCRSTVFGKADKLAATACGVSRSTANRLDKEESAQRKRRSGTVTAKSRREKLLEKYEEEWEGMLRRLIHSKLKEEKDVTRDEVLEEMGVLYPDFVMSRTTLYNFLRALGFSYKVNQGQRYIFEKPDLVRKRQQYLQAIDDARTRGECLVYIDETWIFKGMTKMRGWNDNNIPRFPSVATIKEFSCGKTAGKERGKRRIVIGAMAENGTVPNCSRVFITGYRYAHDDYRDMDSVVFEDWLRTSVPHMQSFANGRHVTLVMDNAPITRE